MLYLKVEARMLVRTSVEGLISSRKAKLTIPEEQSLELVIHDDQRFGRITAGGVYVHLKRERQLINCLSQRDGEEIMKLSPRDFEKIFGRSTSLLLWRSSACEDPEPTVPLIWVKKDDRKNSYSVSMRFTEFYRHIGLHHTTPRIFHQKFLTGGFA